MSILLDTIKAYYRCIDAADIEWVVRLFSPNAIYERADCVYEGAKQIERFFREERKIRGEHKIERLWEVPGAGVVVSTGHFEGVGKAGDARSVAFADIWHFDQQNRIGRRQTFLALGSQYVRE